MVSLSITLCLRAQSVNCGRSVKRETHPPKIVYTRNSGNSSDFRDAIEGSELMGFVSRARAMFIDHVRLVRSLDSRELSPLDLICQKKKRLSVPGMGCVSIDIKLDDEGRGKTDGNPLFILRINNRKWISVNNKQACKYCRCLSRPLYSSHYLLFSPHVCSHVNIKMRQVSIWNHCGHCIPDLRPLVFSFDQDFF